MPKLASHPFSWKKATRMGTSEDRARERAHRCDAWLNSFGYLINAYCTRVGGKCVDAVSVQSVLLLGINVSIHVDMEF